MPPLRKSLNIVALLLAGTVGGYWLSAGAHRGWSMDKVPVAMVDEITGLEYTVYEDRFVPGIEVLAGGLAAAAALLVLSFLLSKKSVYSSSPPP